MAFDTAAFTDVRKYIKRRVAYGRYKIGNTYTRVSLSNVQVLSSGIVRAQMAISEAGPVTITRVELYSSAGELWAHEDVNIIVDTGETGCLYWFDFTVEEVS